MKGEVSSAGAVGDDGVVVREVETAIMTNMMKAMV